MVSRVVAVSIAVIASVACEGPREGRDSSGLELPAVHQVDARGSAEALLAAARSASGGSSEEPKSLVLRATVTASWAPGRIGATYLKILLPDKLVRAELAPGGEDIRWTILDGQTASGQIGDDRWKPTGDVAERLRRQLYVYLMAYFLRTGPNCMASRDDSNEFTIHLSCGRLVARFHDVGPRLWRITYSGTIRTASRDSAVQISPDSSADISKLFMFSDSETKVERRFSDYRLVSGWMVPHTDTTIWDSSRSSTLTVESVRLNVPIGQSDFEEQPLPTDIREWIESVSK